MFRKLSLAVLGCMAMLLAIAATSAMAAEEHNYCADNALSKGVYPPKAQNPGPGDLGTFDITYNPDTAGAETEITGGALICGTDPTLPRYVQEATLKNPGVGEKPRCVAPSTYCSNSVPDGSFLGNAITDVIVKNYFNSELYDQPSTTYAKFDTSNSDQTGQYDDNDCVPAGGLTPISCSETQVSVLGITCSSDVIIRGLKRIGPPTLNGVKTKIQFYIEKPACEKPLIGSRPDLYLMAIDSLTLCKWADATPDSDPTCAESDDPNLWLNKNGPAGPWSHTAVITYTDATTETGVASGNWT